MLTGKYNYTTRNHDWSLAIEIYTVNPALKLLNLQPPIPGYQKFIGTYLFSGAKKAVVDVGPKVAIPNLVNALTQAGTGPEEIDYIVLTHIHLDHAGGIGTAVKALGKARVLAHGRARAHLIDPSALWQASLKTLGDLALKYGDIEPVPAEKIIDASDATKLDLGNGLLLEIYLTPGHAAHHLSLYDRESAVLMAGEAAGVCINGAIRPAFPPPFDLAETLASIDRLIELKARKICYGHFGCYDDATERLKLIRQRLITWCSIATSQAATGKKPEEIFLTLREKDTSLDYLNELDRDEYNREYALLINTIRGLAGTQRT